MYSTCADTLLQSKDQLPGLAFGLPYAYLLWLIDAPLDIQDLVAVVPAASCGAGACFYSADFITLNFP